MINNKRCGKLHKESVRSAKIVAISVVLLVAAMYFGLDNGKNIGGMAGTQPNLVEQNAKELLTDLGEINVLFMQTKTVGFLSNDDFKSRIYRYFIGQKHGLTSNVDSDIDKAMETNKLALLVNVDNKGVWDINSAILAINVKKGGKNLLFGLGGVYDAKKASKKGSNSWEVYEITKRYQTNELGRDYLVKRLKAEGITDEKLIDIVLTGVVPKDSDEDKTNPEDANNEGQTRLEGTVRAQQLTIYNKEGYYYWLSDGKLLVTYWSARERKFTSPIPPDNTKVFHAESQTAKDWIIQYGQEPTGDSSEEPDTDSNTNENGAPASDNPSDGQGWVTSDTIYLSMNSVPRTITGYSYTLGKETLKVEMTRKVNPNYPCRIFAFKTTNSDGKYRGEQVLAESKQNCPITTTLTLDKEQLAAGERYSVYYIAYNQANTDYSFDASKWAASVRTTIKHGTETEENAQPEGGSARKTTTVKTDSSGKAPVTPGTTCTTADGDTLTVQPDKTAVSDTTKTTAKPDSTITCPSDSLDIKPEKTTVKTDSTGKVPVIPDTTCTTAEGDSVKIRPDSTAVIDSTNVPVSPDTTITCPPDSLTTQPSDSTTENTDVPVSKKDAKYFILFADGSLRYEEPNDVGKKTPFGNTGTYYWYRENDNYGIHDANGQPILNVHKVMYNNDGQQKDWKFINDRLDNPKPGDKLYPEQKGSKEFDHILSEYNKKEVAKEIQIKNLKLIISKHKEKKSIK